MERVTIEGDSKICRIDSILQQKLENAFQKQTSIVSDSEIAKIAYEHTPIDLAYAVSHLPPNARPILFDHLPSEEAKAEFILNIDSHSRLAIFRYLKDEQMKTLFEKMSVEDAVAVLEDLSERRYRRVMELLEPRTATKIREQKKHRRNSAGRLMMTEFFAFQMNLTIREASLAIRDNPRIDFAKGIFIVDEKGELKGYIPGRNLIINDPELPLKQVMRPIPHTVLPEATREEVVDLVERYKLSFLPVVDNSKHLLGVIAHEDVLETMEDLAEEALSHIAGTAENSSHSDSILKRFLARAPWLVVTLIAGLANVGIMSFFKRTGGLVVVLLFFVPLITGMSGNIGIQCSTVLVRSMALGNFLCKRDGIKKELFIGFFTGAVFGILLGLVLFIIDIFFPKIPIDALQLATIVGTGLIGACITASFLGVFSPLFFAKIGIDPAIASGPIVTACNDILSMTIYFLISYGLKMLFWNT